jgi:hypothetical protein
MMIKRRLIFSIVVALGAILLTWLLHGESSPLAEYLSSHDDLPNLWLTVNAAPYIVGAVISGSHGGAPVALFTILQFIQWFTLGFLVSTFLFRSRKRG